MSTANSNTARAAVLIAWKCVVVSATYPESKLELEDLAGEVVGLFENLQVRSAIIDTLVLASAVDADEPVILETIELYSGEDHTYPIRQAFKVSAARLLYPYTTANGRTASA